MTSAPTVVTPAELGYVFSGSDRIIGAYGRATPDGDVEDLLVCVTHCVRDRASAVEDAIWRRGEYELFVLGDETHPGWSLTHLVLSRGAATRLDEHLSVHVGRHLGSLGAGGDASPTTQHAPIGLRATLRHLVGPRVVVYTGAGISRASGIPTFTGPGSLDEMLGLAEPYPGRIVTWMLERPDALEHLLGSFQVGLSSSEPNTAHRMLARLERMGQVARIVTSNLDTLHAQAGSAAAGADRYLDAEIAADGCSTLLALGVAEDRYGVVARCRAAGLRIVAADPLPPAFLEPHDTWVACTGEAVLKAWVEAGLRRRRSPGALATSAVLPPPVDARGSRPLAEAVPSILALLTAVFGRSRVTASSVHGTAHWRETAAIAAQLLQMERRADPVVALVFALAHDAVRADDLDDSAHGIRGADLVRSLNTSGVLALDEAQLELAAFACERHSEPVVTSDPTVAVCWDADRLGLGRIGVRPEPALLSLDCSRRCEPVPAPIAWSDVYARYLRLEADRG